MKYEEPMMEIVLIEENVIVTSPTDGNSLDEGANLTEENW